MKGNSTDKELENLLEELEKEISIFTHDFSELNKKYYELRRNYIIVVACSTVIIIVSIINMCF